MYMTRFDPRHIFVIFAFILFTVESPVDIFSIIFLAVTLCWFLYTFIITYNAIYIFKYKKLAVRKSNCGYASANFCLFASSVFFLFSIDHRKFANSRMAFLLSPLLHFLRPFNFSQFTFMVAVNWLAHVDREIPSHKRIISAKLLYPYTACIHTYLCTYVCTFVCTDTSRRVTDA